MLWTNSNNNKNTTVQIPVIMTIILFHDESYDFFLDVLIIGFAVSVFSKSELTNNPSQFDYEILRIWLPTT